MNNIDEMPGKCHDCPYWEICEEPYVCPVDPTEIKNDWRKEYWHLYVTNDIHKAQIHTNKVNVYLRFIFVRGHYITLIINYKLRHFPKNDVDKQFDDVIKKHKTFCR